MFKQILAACALLQLVSSDGLPARLESLKCSRKDPKNFDACFLKGLNESWPEFMKGVPEINMPPLDPFHLDYLQVGDELLLTDFKLTLRNLTDTGYGKAYNYEFHADLVNYSGYIRTYIPTKHAETDYEINGKSLGIDLVDSKGFAVLDLTNIYVYFYIQFKIVTKNNTKYFQLGNPLFCDIKIEKGHLKLTEKDPSRQAEADNLAKIYNGNSGQIMRMAKGFTQYEVVKQFREQTNPILASVPVDGWFSD